MESRLYWKHVIFERQDRDACRCYKHVNEMCILYCSKYECFSSVPILHGRGNLSEIFVEKLM